MLVRSGAMRAGATLLVRDDRLVAALRAGIIVVPARRPPARARRKGGARRLAELTLHEGLESTAATRGRLHLQLNGALSPPSDVMAAARPAVRLLIEALAARLLRKETDDPSG